MPPHIDDVLSANLVLVGVGLLSNPEELGKFRGLVDASFQVETGLVTNVLSGITEPSQTIHLHRDRIVLNLSPSRSTVAREFPDIDNPVPDLEHLSEIADFAIGASNLDGQELRAFGYNLEAMFVSNATSSAHQYLGGRLFGNRFPHRPDWQLAGGSGQLIFQDGNRRWTMTLQPRGDEDESSRVSLGLNLHCNQKQRPELGEMIASFSEIWHEAQQFINWLDQHG